MKLHNIVTSMIMAGILSACSVTPEYQAPETPVAAQYLYQNETTNIAAQTSDHWWLAFNDPVLNQLVEQGQQQNIPLHMAAQQIRSAQAYQQAIASFKVPTVSLGAGYTSYGISENDPLLGPAVTASNPMTGEPLNLVDDSSGAFLAGANISWEMDLFGRIEAQSQAASIRVEQAEIFRQGLTTSITADIVSNYLQLRGAQARLAIAQRNIDEQTTTLALVKQLEKSGFGSAMDVAKASSLLAATQAVSPQLQTAEKVHLHRLAMLLGTTPSQLQGQLKQAAPLPQQDISIPLGLPSELLQRRPDIAMAEREMAAINQEVGAAIAAKYPKFYLSGSPGLVAKDFGDLFNSDSAAWIGSVGIHWNVFDGGRSDALVALNEHRFKSSVLAYQQSVNTAITEVETWLMAYGNSQQYQASIALASDKAELALAKAHTLYQSGLIDHLQVLDAQRQQNALQDAEIVAQLQTWQSVVELHKALGGDWQVPQPVSTSTVAAKG